MASEHQLRREIVSLGKMLHQRGFIAASDGNLSVRLDKKRILCTPTAMSKGAMRPSDMVVVDYEGCQLSGRRSVSSEIAMHCLIYRLRPDVQAVVHLEEALPPEHPVHLFVDLVR